MAYDLTYRLGKDYEKPGFGIQTVPSTAWTLPIHERVELEQSHSASCAVSALFPTIPMLKTSRTSLVVLIVAPLSGHYSTLLRDTVKAACCATTRSISPTGRMPAWCPLSEGEFHLDDYVNYVQEFIRHLQKAMATATWSERASPPCRCWQRCRPHGQPGKDTVVRGP